MNFLDDLRYTLKVIAKNRWFTLICASVIAIGLGIVLPAWSVMDNLLMKAPAFPDGERFAAITKVRPPGPANARAPVTGYDAFHYRYFKDNSTSFEGLHAWRNQRYTLSDGDFAAVYGGAAVEPELMQMPQVQPELGRLLNASDAEFGASPVAVISHDVWQSYYAGREDIIGLTARINGAASTIVGVMPPDYRFPLNQDLWVPLAIPATVNAAEGAADLILVGKLQPGVSLPQASAEIALLQSTLLENWKPQYDDIQSSKVVPYVRMLGETMNPAVGAVLLTILLLLVAFNVGNLFIARAEERLGELAIRSALGASRVRIGSALLLESFLVCALGLLGAWVLGYFSIGWINFMITKMGAPVIHYFWWDMSLNGAMLRTSALAVLVFWLLCGGLPAWRLSRGSLNELLTSGTKGAGDKRTTRLSKILVNFQLVVGCVLLTMGVAVGTTFFSSVITTTEGSDHLFMGTLDFSRTALAEQAARQQYLGDFARVLATEPGVQQIAFTSAPPGGGGEQRPYTLEEQDLKVGDAYPSTFVMTVSSTYLEALGASLMDGRRFNAGDTEGSQPVAIIDERFARKYWPDASPVGKRIRIDPEADAASWVTIVGVSRSIVQEGLLAPGQEGNPVIFLAASQSVPPVVHVLARMAALDVTPATLLQTVAGKVNRDIPVADTRTLQQVESVFADGAQVNRRVAAAFIFLAIYVTGIATYGLASRVAGRRRVETGIRMALGASRRDSLKVFIKDGFRTVVVGLSIGGIMGVMMSFGVLSTVNSGTAFAMLVPIVLIIGLTLGALVMLANYLPARQLIDMDPADALRHE